MNLMARKIDDATNIERAEMHSPWKLTWDNFDREGPFIRYGIRFIML